MLDILVILSMSMTKILMYGRGGIYLHKKYVTPPQSEVTGGQAAGSIHAQIFFDLFYDNCGIAWVVAGGGVMAIYFIIHINWARLAWCSW